MAKKATSDIALTSAQKKLLDWVTKNSNPLCEAIKMHMGKKKMETFNALEFGARPKPPKVKLEKKEIWVFTACHNPFQFGPGVEYIKAKVEGRGPYDIGRGYKVYVVKSPAGKIHLALMPSGAFIGSSLAQVRKDVTTGDANLMARQMAEANQMLVNAKELSAATFWKRMREH